MEFFVIYLLVVIEKIAAVLISAEVFLRVAFIATLIVGFLGLVIGLFTLLDANDKEVILARNWYTKHVPIRGIAILAIIGCVVPACGKIMPSQKEMAIIVGSGVVYNAVTSETGQRLGNKATAALEKKIDEILQEDTTSTAAKNKVQSSL